MSHSQSKPRPSAYRDEGAKTKAPILQEGIFPFFFLWVYPGQGPEEFCGGFDITSVKTNFLISLLLWAKDKAVFPWSMGDIWGRKKYISQTTFH